MKVLSVSSVRRVAVALAMALALAGCGGATSTPVPVTPTATATSAPTPTPTPTATPTPAPTASPTATPTPTAAPTTDALAACTGTDAHRALFVEAASVFTFDVYCAALPSSWWLQSTSYKLPSGGELEIEYKNAAGATLSMLEGSICPPPLVCAFSGSTIGPASFGGVAGTLYLVDSEPTYQIAVGPLTLPRYVIYGRGMSQANFVSWAAALVKVHKCIPPTCP